MNPVHLVLIWHMHQPEYKDPATRTYFLPWTRLHALKDYWGMVKILDEFPEVHMTFNVVPSLAAQIQEYASGNFREPWFDVAFAASSGLTLGQRREILLRAFQANTEHLVRRWPRFAQLFDGYQSFGLEATIARLGVQDWRDLQVLSQIAWMDEEYLAHDPVVSALSAKGEGYTESDKRALRDKQLELLGRVLPEYGSAAKRGQIEISATPFYHPILPLLCDTDVARISNPHTPLPHPPYQHPEDAREQLSRARAFHQKTFGQLPAGLWPSEGSVSDPVVSMAAEMGFRWFATDEGVLGHSRGLGFARDGSGFPQNAEALYTPWKIRYGGSEIAGFFRDHYISDLIGFVYSRIDARSAAEDFHRRVRAVGERVSMAKPTTLVVIVDGENAWEYYDRNGREFLRRFYDLVRHDPDIHALTASEAIEAAGEIPVLDHIFPGSWINANFDVWIGDKEDVRAWELLGAARREYEDAVRQAKENARGAPSAEQLARAYESILVAEGSDWNWWYGPEHSTANDAEFDSLYRKHLSEVYAALGREAPTALAQPIKKQPQTGKREAPAQYLDVQVDGRESSYFEWLGAGTYSVDRRSGALHVGAGIFSGLSYGFSRDRFFVRLDKLPADVTGTGECELRFTFWDGHEKLVTVRLAENRVTGITIHPEESPDGKVAAAAGKIIEVSFARDLFGAENRKSLQLSVSVWKNGLPLDVVPSWGYLEIPLGEDVFAWPFASA
ncbi:MAG: glycoside hydrolase family 57 protein [Candidatus Acidiferrales bacterium]